ncbi:MAG TPA: gamma-glutamyl-gamma-aminobutyrate hydrolase family protein [Pseudonocardia sp.]
MATTSAHRPLIGITAYGEPTAYGVWEHEAVLLPRTYTDAVLAVGGLPVLLPPRAEAAQIVERLDGVVLAGGPDVDPSRYGAARDPHTGPPRTERDAAELAVLARALELSRPVLAVCRGLQVLNVGLGGTLVQHVPDVVGHAGHNPQPGVFGRTEIAFEPGSLIDGALGRRIVGQCHHHQAIARPADGLAVTGRAQDGTIEAVELSGHPFVVGVQWHPEQDDPRIFAALVAAVTEKEQV